MTTKARLAKLEGTLSPKAATLLWLAEAHQFPTLPAYVAWLVDQPGEAAPFRRVPEQAERAIRTALRGEPRSVVQGAVRQTIRDAVTLVELVIRVNVEAAETIRIEGLRYVAICWGARAIRAEAELLPATEDQEGCRAITRRWTDWRGAVTGWLADLDVSEEAWRLLERRYFDGCDLLFLDLRREWHALREAAERLAGLGVSIATQRKGRSRTVGPSGTALGRRAEADAVSLADSARAAALGLLGDTGGASATLRRR